MQCNVDYLKLVMWRAKNDASKKKSHPRKLVLEIHVKTTEMEKHISPYLHSDYAVDMFESGLRNEIPWTQRHDFHVAFNDLGYIVHSPSLEGFVVWEYRGSEGSFKQHWITFPGEVLAEALMSMRPGAYGTRREYEFPASRLLELRRSHWPIVHIKWAPEALERYTAVMTGKVPLMTEENREELRRALKGNWRIARGISHGNPSTVNMSCDSMEHSFYWWIGDCDERRYMNGGIIAHRETASEEGVPWNEQEVVGYHYSVHT